MSGDHARRRGDSHRFRHGRRLSIWERRRAARAARAVLECEHGPDICHPGIDERELQLGEPGPGFWAPEEIAQIEHDGLWPGERLPDDPHPGYLP